MEKRFIDEIYPDDDPKFNKDRDDKFMEDKRKRFNKSRRHEEAVGSFRCSHCHTIVPISPEMGTSHRNHCNTCLWSKHVDEKTPGDRKSECKAGMKPIGITLKHEGRDKYTNKDKYGDVMIIHQCMGCNKININRIAADDYTDTIMGVFDQSKDLPSDLKNELVRQDIKLFGESERTLITERIFGK